MWHCPLLLAASTPCLAEPRGLPKPTLLAAGWQQPGSALQPCLCQQSSSRETAALAALPQAHSMQQLPLLRDPPPHTGWRTHPEPGHSASPGPALSCGKICSWSQNHTGLEEKGTEQDGSCTGTGLPSPWHADPSSTTLAQWAQRPKPCSPLEQRHTAELPRRGRAGPGSSC